MARSRLRTPRHARPQRPARGNTARLLPSPVSSCPDLFRASTRSHTLRRPRPRKMDGRDKPGHDDARERAGRRPSREVLCRPIPTHSGSKWSKVTRSGPQSWLKTAQETAHSGSLWLKRRPDLKAERRPQRPAHPAFRDPLIPARAHHDATLARLACAVRRTPDHGPERRTRREVISLTANFFVAVAELIRHIAVAWLHGRRSHHTQSQC